MSATVFSTVAFVASAIPAPPRPVVMRQPDGSWAEVMIHGDERASFITAADGSRLLRVDPATGALTDAGPCAWQLERRSAAARREASPLRIAGGASPYPAHGKQRALAVLVEFPATDITPGGVPFTLPDPRGHFTDLLNKPGYSTGGATGSVHDYFFDNSDGAFDLTFDVFGPVTLSRDVTFYSEKLTGGDLNAWNMAVEALTALDDQVDFSVYDRDHDGIIDNVYVFYAGPGAATGGNPQTSIWQHAGDVETISGRRHAFDGVRLNHYACSNEYRDVRADNGSVERLPEGIGTVTHEFSHVLGLPDFYDTLGNGTRSPGLWALMDTGCHLNESRTPPCMTAYERMMLGWVEPRVIGAAPESVTLRPIADNDACVIPTASDSEFFLLENRQIAGWDSYIPGHGMLVWHINYSPDYWAHNQVNTVPGLPGISVVAADGNVIPDTPGAPFPGTAGVTSITDEGYPNLCNFYGDPTGVPLSAIAEVGQVVNFDVCRLVTSLPAVTGLSVRDLRPDRFTASWSPCPAYGVSYRISVCAAATGEPVGIYRDLTAVDTVVTVEGLTPETDYYFTVTAVAGAVKSATSDRCPVSTPAMSFAFSAPVATEATAVTDGSFTANWLPLEGAEGYRLTVYGKRRGEPDRSTLDFAGQLTDLPDGWTTTTGFTIGMNGYFGAGSPALSLTDDYASLQSAVLPHDLRSLSFWYRERSGSGKSHIAVSMLVDGSWTEVARVPLTDKAAATFTLDEESTPEGARAVRIVYRRVGQGTLAIDDVELTYNNRYTVIPLDGFDGLALGADRLSCPVPVADPAARLYYTVCGIDADGVRSLPSNEVSVGAPSAIVAPSLPSSGPVRVFDLNGRPVNPDLKQLPRGIYIMTDGVTVTKKTI